MSFVATAEVFSVLHAQLAARGVDIDTAPFFIDGTDSRVAPSHAFPKTGTKGADGAQPPQLDSSEFFR
jgi:hypothetical protein